MQSLEYIRSFLLGRMAWSRLNGLLLISGAFGAFDKKMPGFLTNDAVVHAPESRTSSPILIPRNRETFQHVEIENLYPCAEGAGYAGGIVSAAIDNLGKGAASQAIQNANLICGLPENTGLATLGLGV